MDRRTFTKTLGAGTLGTLVSPFTVLGSMEPGEAGLRTGQHPCVAPRLPSRQPESPRYACTRART